MNKKHIRLPENTAGRDFVCGDIHGHYSRLLQGLEQVNFDFQRDRLISVGDVFDRGPENERCIDLLFEPWFHSVMGNHEALIISSEWFRNESKISAQGMQARRQQLEHGGQWVHALDSATHKKLYNALLQRPIAIEVMRHGKKYAVVHADIPFGLDWDATIRQLTATDAAQQQRTEQQMLWSRKTATTAKHLLERDIRPDSEDITPLAGVEAIYIGHTSMAQPVRVHNYHFIDTGACYAQTSGQFSPEICLIELGASQPASHHELVSPDYQAVCPSMPSSRICASL